MLTDARSGQFDALVVHKWDRLARSRFDAVRYKAMLRRECTIKLFAVEGVSEDEDEFVGMLCEAMIEVWSKFYSRNLSCKTRKGKHEKASEGKHNNQAQGSAGDLGMLSAHSPGTCACPNPVRQRFDLSGTPCMNSWHV